MRCRHCNSELTAPFIDLGSAPPSNSYLTKAKLGEPENWFPLRVRVCKSCWLAQNDFTHPEELFADDYAYFSSYSAQWLRHCEAYVAQVIERLRLGKESMVIEIAANDGYLLQYVQQRGIPCLGIEPTASTAQVARDKGIEIREDFFGLELANKLVAEGHAADLTVANNVLAHVPDINDFVSGFTRLLNPRGVATFEFPHLMQLVASCQFDTVYHEHFCYLSLTAVRHVFERNGLMVFDVEEIEPQGGSLRVYAQRADTGRQPVAASVVRLLGREAEAGVSTASYYEGFQARADRIKDDFVAFLIEAKRKGKRVLGYGAAAKGNTLLNYGGVRPDLIEFIADRNPAKQGKFMPGSRIPIVGEDQLRAAKPDYVVLLPWNLRTEVSAQLAYIAEWGGQLVTAVPRLEIGW